MHRYGLVALLVVSCALVPDLTFLWGLTLLNFLCGDNFPFSRFSMYSHWTDFADYVYVTDEHDDPIATRRFRLSASTLQKLYHANVDVGHDLERFRHCTADELAPAGHKVLAFLLARAETHGPPLTCRRLRLYQVNLHYRHAAVDEQKLFISELPVC